MSELVENQVERILAAAERRMKLFYQDQENFRFRTAVKSRCHSKRHGENKERSFLDRTKAAKHAKNKKAYIESRRVLLACAKKYWNGQGDHP